MGGPSKGWKNSGVESIVYRVVRSGLGVLGLVSGFVACVDDRVGWERI